MLNQIIDIVFNESLRYWWIISPIILFFILDELWLAWRKSLYLSQLNWILLEIKLPRDLKRSTKAMSQLLAALHVIQSDADSFKDKYLEGKQQEWYSLEISARSGSVNFYIYTPDKFRNFIEAQVYAQYPGAEIIEVQDYSKNLPASLPSSEYDLWGMELERAKNEPLPIKTYPVFEAGKEEEATDSMSSLMEILGTLKPGENIWIQHLIKPIDGKKWREESETAAAKLLKKKLPEPKKGFDPIDSALKAIAEFLGNLTPTPESEKKEEKEEKPEPTLKDREAAEAIERNLLFPAYDTQIRFVYSAPPAVFSRVQVAAILSHYKKFGVPNYNSLKPSKDTVPGAKWSDFDKEGKILSKKKKLFNDYKSRQFGPTKPYPMSTEELATLWHFPSALVLAPTVTRIEAKKAEPPSNLPVL